MNNFLARIRKFALAGVLASLVAGAVLVVPSLNVFASANPQTVTPPAAQATPADQTSRLEQRLKNEQTWLTAQGNRIDRSNTLTERAQQVIDRFKGKGVDVTPLQTALDNFKSTLPSAAQVHATASGILAAHNGFDANGVVTDPKAAQVTVQSAYESLEQARQILNSAFSDLRNEIRTFRQNHKPKAPAAPTATPAPAM
jgi:hypothetical protein